MTKPIAWDVIFAVAATGLFVLFVLLPAAVDLALAEALADDVVAMYPGADKGALQNQMTKRLRTSEGRGELFFAILTGSLATLAWARVFVESRLDKPGLLTV